MGQGVGVTDNPCNNISGIATEVFMAVLHDRVSRGASPSIGLSKHDDHNFVVIKVVEQSMLNSENICCCEVYRLVKRRLRFKRQTCKHQCYK